MVRHKMINGICRLCGHKTNLSFEHVPPKVTNNKKHTLNFNMFQLPTHMNIPLDYRSKNKIKLDIQKEKDFKKIKSRN